MTMTKGQARSFIENELIPMVKVTDPQVYCSLAEDFEALQVALTSGNRTLVMAMASYIRNLSGLINGIEIAQKISSKVL